MSTAGTDHPPPAALTAAAGLAGAILLALATPSTAQALTLRWAYPVETAVAAADVEFIVTVAGLQVLVLASPVVSPCPDEFVIFEAELPASFEGPAAISVAAHNPLTGETSPSMTTAQLNPPGSPACIDVTGPGPMLVGPPDAQLVEWAAMLPPECRADVAGHYTPANTGDGVVTADDVNVHVANRWWINSTCPPGGPAPDPPAELPPILLGPTFH